MDQFLDEPVRVGPILVHNFLQVWKPLPVQTGNELENSIGTKCR